MRQLQLSCDLQTLNLAPIYCHTNLNFVNINFLCLSQVIFQDFLLKDQFPVPVQGALVHGTRKNRPYRSVLPRSAKKTRNESAYLSPVLVAPPIYKGMVLSRCERPYVARSYA